MKKHLNHFGINEISSETTWEAGEMGGSTVITYNGKVNIQFYTLTDDTNTCCAELTISKDEAVGQSIFLLLKPPGCS